MFPFSSAHYYTWMMPLAEGSMEVLEEVQEFLAPGEEWVALVDRERQLLLHVAWQEDEVNVAHSKKLRFLC